MSMVPWMPPGPVSQAFLETDDDMALLMGPVGSAKTTTGLMRGVMRSYFQKPDARGIRYAKFGVIRRLEKDLLATTMQSWLRWFPRTLGKWGQAQGAIAVHELRLAHPVDGGPIELQVEFKSLGDMRIEEALRGWEGTYGYADEADLLAEGAMTFLYSRCGRYPAKNLLGWKGVWGTCNAPEVDSYVVKDFIDDLKPGNTFFRQPGGLDPGAENLENLPDDYYQKLAEKLLPHDKARFVDNKPGISRDGEAVYPEFNETLHMAAKPLRLIPGRPLIVGMDAGGTPAAGVFQRAANGQWRKYRELTTHAKDGGSITGPNRFGEALRDLLAELMTDDRGNLLPLVVRGQADPSAAYGADTANGESSWIDTVARVAGIPVMAAPTNDPTPRREAYRLPMGRMIDGQVPGLVIDPSCKFTKIALMRDYKFPMIKGPSGTRKADHPAKNWASHMIEADQYALLDGQAFNEVLARSKAASQARIIVASSDFNVFR